MFVGGTVCTAAQDDNSRRTLLAAKAGGGNWRVAFDGVSQTVSANSTDFGRIMFGADGAFGEYTQGNVYRMVAYERNPSAGEQALIEAYLGS